MQQILTKNIGSFPNISQQLLELSKEFSVFSILNSNQWKLDQYAEYDIIAAFGSAKEIISTTNNNAFAQIRKAHQSNAEWMFGYLAYDLKNELEELKSKNKDFINAPEMQFFIPQLLVLIKEGKLDIQVHDDFINDKHIEKSIEFLFQKHNQAVKKSHKIEIKHRIHEQDYLLAIKKIREHIKHGDIYELNFCQEFYSQNIEIEPHIVFQKLINKSPTPFSAFMRFDNLYTMSASPERFLKKVGDKIISQPIKGTARREKDETKDQQAIELLQNDTKERAENIMIVDLVRNDLAHTAKKNSVKVDELCKIYSFEQVHQMISTVSSQLDKKYDFVDLLKTSFPMGSMTGAPKIRAMELIEQYEASKRGIYSGAIGYITPNGDFDFSVVIRSLIYNQRNKYLSFIAGGAITYQSDPKKEYAESLLKAEAIREILS